MNNINHSESTAQGGKKVRVGNNILYLLIILVLSLALVLFSFGYFNTQQELIKTRALLAAQKQDERVLNFLDMFIKDVLNASSAITFETRLNLETAVRQLDNATILAQWDKFLKSKNETEAQNNVKVLLGLLVDNISKRVK